MNRVLWLGFVLLVSLICTGCGDTFRPIIIPNPPVFPNPKAAHTVISINDNGDIVAGSAMVVDVSGDTDVSVADVGIHPIHAVQQTATQVLVVNEAVIPNPQPPTTSCLVTVNNEVLNVCPSLSKMNFSGISIGTTSSISLPIYSGANFVAGAPLDTTAYVTLPTYPPDPTVPTTIVPSVGVVNLTSANLIATIPVGDNPVALAVTPDKSKLYVANKADSTISGFNTSDRSQRTGSPVATSSAPIWLVARNDSQRVFALEASGALEWLDTTSTAGPDTLTATGISVPGASTMVYDSNKNRLYVPGGPLMAVVDVSGTAPVLLKTIAIPEVPGVPAVAANAVEVAALPDGSRAYVASAPAAAQTTQLSVTGVQGDGVTATYTYTLTAGHNPTPGISLLIAGIPTPNDGLNGTYTVTSASGSGCDQPASGCTFQTANATKASQTPVNASAASTIDNLFPQVTVVDVASNTIKTTIGLPGFPDATVVSSPYYAAVCALAPFRYAMAAGGDSSRAYLSSCDAGNVNIIDTSTDTYVLNLPAPVGTRPAIPPNQQNQPQNPVFLIAGP